MKSLGLRPRDPKEAHRAASPLELFTDLCYVVAIAQAAAQLHHAISEDHVLSGVVYFCIAFFAIWWAWLNFAWFNSAYDPDDVPHRLLTLLQVFGSLVVAAGIPRMFDGDLMLVVAGYVVMRIGLVLMWVRAAHGHAEGRRTALRYALGLMLIQAAWVGAAIVTGGDIPVPVIVVLVLCDVLVPVLAESAGSTPWHPHHIAERYGLMFIIVLGEVVLSVTFAIQDAFDAEDPPAALWMVVLGGVLATFSAWWLYFSREDARVLSDDDASGFVWGFGHYLIYGTITAFGAGLAARVDLVTHHSHTTEFVSSAAITVPAALFILALWFADVRLHDSTVRTAALFGGVAAVLLALTWMPMAEAFVGVVFVGLLVIEAVRRRKSVARPEGPH